MSLLQGKRAKSRNAIPLSFSARNSAYCENTGSFLLTITEGGIEQLEDTKKSNISERPLHHCCGSRFLCAFAKVLCEQGCNRHGAEGIGGHSGGYQDGGQISYPGGGR
ncbi:hypothetical protein [Petroclostridium sp. X23]|uniref:hypothetical protein n=1 Tax=Petroclostridium sp. X23 TaxID=3045146 RepID=UPI0024AD5E7A|nr:hypothetical protein [Petroclostridium sp. X23]WHH59780.1 hypothetical protein QKW49_03215 [Petroclostridium sp. X23]